jgi:PAS domain S-box-containing protein
MNLASKITDGARKVITSNTPKILIVDDEPRMCDSLKALLSGDGYEIHTGYSGQQALECLAKNGFDLVLLDLVMPDINGRQIMDHINSQNIEAFVIVITGHATVDSAIESLRKGAYDYIRKPFQCEELLKAVRNALDQKRLKSERKRAEEMLRESTGRLEVAYDQSIIYAKQLNEQITGRKRTEEALRESKTKYTTLVENSLTGIYIDQDEKIVFANHRFAEIYRYPREKLVGIESWKIVHPEDRDLTSEIRARRLKGEEAPLEYEARGLTKDGETIWIKRRNTRMEYKGRPAVLGNIVDITEQKRAEEELRNMNEELKNFVHAVSHDLKNPIISVHGFSSRLLKKYQEKLGEEGQNYLDHIMASARQMELLVSDLLALSSIGRVVSPFKDVSSLEIVKNVTSGLQHRLKDSGIELVVADNLPTIYCDGARIFQVFENLLTNATKFMGGTKNPKIEIGYEDRGDFHQFYMRDNGIGIEPKYHLKIFETFHRLEEIEDEEGTGLGLAIVKRIVNNHGGSVWVDSKKGKGATFYFTLPKAS